MRAFPRPIQLGRARATARALALITAWVHSVPIVWKRPRAPPALTEAAPGPGNHQQPPWGAWPRERPRRVYDLPHHLVVEIAPLNIEEESG